jgi:hypothetical protein
LSTILVRSSFIWKTAGSNLPTTRLILVIREAVGAGVIGPVETADLERAVIGAVTGTDTTVVRHLVQAFGAMVGRIDRANILAGGIVAMLTQHRLESDLHVVRVVQALRLA